MGTAGRDERAGAGLGERLAPDGIGLRERITISRTSTGNFSHETTCEITSVVGWAEVIASPGDEASDVTILRNTFLVRRLEALGRMAAREITWRKSEESA